jgi:membrane-associated phospholipid phosphatase
MAPSLHVTEIMLLWVIYSRHTSSWLRSAIQVWLLLVIASTLLVWQHHVIDVITGFLLGVVCFLVFPDRRFAARLAAA